MTNESAKDALILHLERELKATKMTLRDRFAMHAMAAFIQASASNDIATPTSMAAISNMSYPMADAMMEARKQ